MENCVIPALFTRRCVVTQLLGEHANGVGNSAQRVTYPGKNHIGLIFRPDFIVFKNWTFHVSIILYHRVSTFHILVSS
jgi:hypothetical protein